jgi:16S rRNA G966 N2-methylase RsmD
MRRGCRITTTTGGFLGDPDSPGRTAPGGNGAEEDSLQPNTVLRRAPNLRLQLDSTNSVTAMVGERTVSCGPRGLAVLDAFYRPTSFSEALGRLEKECRSAQDWMDVTGAIVSLYKCGILQDEADVAPGSTLEQAGFAGPAEHAVMLNDRARTSAFIFAIREVVEPGDVVLDLGTGSGVLAVAAARAGARRVFALEAGGMAGAARAVAEANGLGDKVDVIQDWSTQVSLAERADVLVSEIIGDDPLGERVLEIFLDARKRFLKPDARLIPGELRLFGIPLSLTKAHYERRVPTHATFDRWKNWYGIDFSPLERIGRDVPHVVFVDPVSVRGLTAVADPVLLAQLQLSTFDSLIVDEATEAVAASAAEVNALAVYFEATLSRSNVLSTNPATTDLESSWSLPMWLLKQPIELEAGERFSISYKYRVPGEREGVHVSSA